MSLLKALTFSAPNNRDTDLHTWHYLLYNPSRLYIKRTPATLAHCGTDLTTITESGSILYRIPKDRPLSDWRGRCGKVNSFKGFPDQSAVTGDAGVESKYQNAFNFNCHCTYTKGL
ncbi:hypothetical protein BaRGS_00012645 [Batillaria attramentaria]|uniref:Uncharacterized protein n=1 Tax=Batillaria attramentaria TaxID=370345 RepID=A0ABD0LA42_9CAEN